MPVDTALAQEQWDRFTYLRDRGHLDFVAKADKCDAFFAGDQWRVEDLTTLNNQRRPAMTINKIISTVGTILGEQIYNRTEVLFRPTAGAPAPTAEALAKVWMQISQNNQLPWTRSDVFCDGMIRSRGFYDVRMGFDDALQGEVRISLLNSKNVVIDADAEEYDPDGWNDVFISKWVTPMDVAVLYNEDDAEYLKHARGQDIGYGYDSIERARDRFGGPGIIGNDSYLAIDPDSVRSIRVLERQFRRLDKQLHFVDVANGDMRLVPSDWDRNRIAAFLEKTGGRLSTYKKLVKRLRWRVTAGSVVLHDDWMPYKHFTVVPYFPYFRYGKTIGIVENLLGPQEILNKASSQELHVINTTANSGWAVEENSLVNMTVGELENKGAQTGLVLEYRKGATPPDKITPNQVPTGLDRITYKAEEHIKSISNVSDSMQGFDREDVAAKAIAYKQQRGSVNMTKVLDNLERTDWILARNTLDLIQNYYSEERIINITHDDVTQEAETIVVNQMDPATGQIVNDLTLGEYDVVITSSPYRASLEDSQFDQAKGLREIGVPIDDSVLIENSRLLRRSEILKNMKAKTESPEAQAAAALQQRAQAAEVAKAEAEAQKILADAKKSMADTTLKAQEAQAGGNGGQEFALEERRIEMELAMKREELEMKREELAMKLQMQREMHAQDMAIKQQQAQQDARLKEQQAEQQAAAQQVQALRGGAQKQTAETTA